MVWTFSRVHRAGYSDAQRNYLRAADGGVEFLRRHFRDPVHGGYYGAVDAAGAPRNERKMMYGQAFVIYALVEHHRASSNSSSLAEARNLFAAIDRYARDRRHGAGSSISSATGRRCRCARPTACPRSQDSRAPIPICT